jgi:hypothetical protein
MVRVAFRLKHHSGMLLLAISLLFGTGCEPNKEKAEPPVEFVSEDMAALSRPDELLVSVTDDFDLVRFKEALQALSPELEWPDIEWVGPPKNRLFKLTIPPPLTLDVVAQTVSGFSGIQDVAPNYVSVPLEQAPIKAISQQR